MALTELAVQRVAQSELILRNADVNVWGKPGFPEQHRPDVALLRGNIHFGAPHEPIIFTFHPAIIPEHRADLKVQLERCSATHKLNKAATSYPDTHEIFLRDDVVIFADSDLRRIMYHEAATDHYAATRAVASDQYSELQRTQIEALINDAFAEVEGITLTDTSIDKQGFREILKVGEYVVCDLNTDPLFDALNEIYPTIIEIITAELVRGGTDIRRFDRAIKSGAYRFMENEHPNFTQALLEVMRIVDWRDLLDAFMIADISKTLEHLDGLATDGITSGNDIVEKLLRGMNQDELRLQRINEVLMREAQQRGIDTHFRLE